MPSPSAQCLQGQTAVVTGASGAIGSAIARELAGAGAHVIVHTWRGVDVAAQLTRELQRRNVESCVQQADLADDQQHERFVHECWLWKQAIDIWVNNAGADVLTGEGGRASYEQKLNRLWNVDVLATVRLSRLVGARMRARGQGVILNMGWDQAATGMAGDSGELFATTKGAIMAFTRSLAKSLAPQVRVNCLAPGWIQTSWGAQANNYWQQRALRESLRGRWGKPEDVACAALYLASPAADFMTGQILNVDGGLSGGDTTTTPPRNDDRPSD